MSRSQARIANEHIVSQVLRKKMAQDARAGDPRVSSLLQSSPLKSPTARPNMRTVTFAASQDTDEHLDRGSRCGPGDASGSCAQMLLPSQLLQEGVKSMGGALEVSPSAFGGFTVREDFVMAMRLNFTHARSMPAEGEPACLPVAVHMRVACMCIASLHCMHRHSPVSPQAF